MRHLVTLVLAATLAGCVEEARMAVSPGLASGERLELAGLGGWRSGEFRLGGNRGSFSRDETRLGIFEPLFVRNSAAAAFTLAGADFPAPVAARCEGREDTTGWGAFVAPTSPFRYECGIEGATGRLALAAASQGLVDALTRSGRRGALELEGRRFDLVSEHRYEGAALSEAAPVGYRVEEGGRAVAAVDLNGTDKTVILAPGLDATGRRAALIAATAVALLADPADSDL